MSLVVPKGAAEQLVLIVLESPPVSPPVSPRIPPPSNRLVGPSFFTLNVM